MALIKHHEHQFTIKVLSCIAAAACENEGRLDLLSLVNYIDLYRNYILDIDNSNTANDSAEPVEFERFISDETLLNLAALRAQTETGESVKAPAAIKVAFEVPVAL